MEFFNPKNLKFNFANWIPLFFKISLVLTVVSLVSVVKPGINYGIDFRGGVQVEIQSASESLNEKSINDILAPKIENLQIQSSKMADGKNGFLLTANSGDSKSIPNIISASLGEKHPPDTWTISKVDMVGPRVGADLKKSALLSIIYTCLLIAVYIWWRFDLRFAPGALACIFHDLALSIGLIVFTGMEFSTTIVAALLTLAGYSVNDTVVVYDRIRELEAKHVGRSKKALVNEALNSSLSRTMMTSVTTLASCVVLYFLGGETLQPFALVLFIGIIVGTYSSIFVACPIYIKMDEIFNRNNKPGTIATHKA